MINISYFNNKNQLIAENILQQSDIDNITNSSSPAFFYAYCYDSSYQYGNLSNVNITGSNYRYITFNMSEFISSGFCFLLFAYSRSSSSSSGYLQFYLNNDLGSMARIEGMTIDGDNNSKYISESTVSPGGGNDYLFHSYSTLPASFSLMSILKISYAE